MWVIDKLKKFFSKPKAKHDGQLIDVRDYPRSDYRVYWQYFIWPKGGKYSWKVEFLNFSDSSVALVTSGDSATYTDARLEAQRSAYDEMSKFKR